MMCPRCTAKLARSQVRLWCLQIAVASHRGFDGWSALLDDAATVTFDAQILDPVVTS